MCEYWSIQRASLLFITHYNFSMNNKVEMLRTELSPIVKSILSTCTLLNFTTKPLGEFLKERLWSKARRIIDFDLGCSLKSLRRESAADQCYTLKINCPNDHFFCKLKIRRPLRPTNIFHDVLCVCRTINFRKVNFDQLEPRNLYLVCLFK